MCIIKNFITLTVYDTIHNCWIIGFHPIVVILSKLYWCFNPKGTDILIDC